MPRTSKRPKDVDAPGRKSKVHHPKFAALSYVWGSPDNPSHVRITSGRHPGTLPITRNLDIALRHIRHPSEVRYIWVDAMCINQADLKEKSHQVQNMYLVYTHAYVTIAWLGPQAEHSGEAISQLQFMHDRLPGVRKTDDQNDSSSREDKRAVSDGSYHPRTLVKNDGILSGVMDRIGPVVDQVMFRLDNAFDVHHNVLKEWPPSMVLAVYSLLNRPYFERAWIRQEIQCAEAVIFQCGYYSFMEEVLWKCVFNLRLQSFDTDFSQAETNVSKAEWSRVLDQIDVIGNLRANGVFLTILDIRYELRGAKCQDARDRIYAFLHMVHLADLLNIRADYTKTIQETYISVAQVLIHSANSLEVLRACELSTRALKIPSWVPDWSTPPQQGGHVLPPWSACGFISADKHPKVSELCCPASGIRIDRVTKVIEHSIAYFTASDDIDRDMKRNFDHASRFLYAIKPSEMRQANGYITGENVYEAYCPLLTWDHYRDEKQPWDPIDHFDESMAYLVQVWSLDTTNFEDNFAALARGGDRLMHKLLELTQGKQFIETEQGYAGFAPVGTEVGDVVCVLLGSDLPVILRRSDVAQNWLVVGTAWVHGLMYGEAIYRNRHSVQYRFGSNEGSTKGRKYYDECINGLEVAYLDPAKSLLENDPVKLLEEAGIEVESFANHPHKLIVREESLRAAGVLIEDFILV
jgi:hypothetical protein